MRCKLSWHQAFAQRHFSRVPYTKAECPASPGIDRSARGRWLSLRDPLCKTGAPSPRATPRTRKTGDRLRRKEGGDVTAVQSTIGQPGFARNRPIGTGRGLRYVIRYVGPGPHHHGFAPYTEAECPASPERGLGCGRRTPTFGQPGSAPFGPKGCCAALRGALPGTKLLRTPTWKMGGGAG